ncbi:ATP-dependent DNA helicase RecG [Candidatus Shapirobacteria bacterium]|nr:ATP-dependent DNA helicase RecG [Candidatus Shapirobacteria bacterium]
MDSLSQIPRLGPKTLEKLTHLKINTPSDLIYHFPSRYLDFSKVVPISQAKANETITISANVKTFQNIFTRSHKNIQRAVVFDDSGTIELLWFNQPYLSKKLIVGQKLSFAGTPSLYKNHLTIIAPAIGLNNTGKIIAIYPETKGLPSSWFRNTIQSHLHQLTHNFPDHLPPEIIDKYQLVDRADALRQIHAPTNFSSLEVARYRLALEEILALQTQSLLQKKSWSTKTPQYVFKTNPIINTKITKFIKFLPFELTADQLTTWNEINTDLSSKNPMNRLLQGDVGSGKTIVALLACLVTHYHKTISLLIAPTGVLAHQHFSTFKKLLPKIPVELLTAEHKIDLKKIKPNSIVIATHSAIYQKTELSSKIGLVIFDEQHKFGVDQRNFLADLSSPPHCLTMTATPIPRTIGLTLMGNLSLSSINTLPKNRQIIKTFTVPKQKISGCYDWLAKHISTTKQQAFIVCPLIEESETLTTVKSVKAEFDLLQKIFPEFKLGLIHGKIKTVDRQKILADFQKNKIQILVSTPIIEVGIDFPNSTTIIIQSADRFGLAQLHQLRGRVGRGSDQSYCYLFSESENEKSQARLQFLTTHHQGFEIAEFDLKTRGPGEIFSTIQHGFPSLKLSQLNDYELISTAQKILVDITTHHPHFDLNKLISHSSNIQTKSLN